MYRIFVGKPEGRKPLRKPRHRWKCYIKLGLKKTECEAVDWLHVSQDRDQWRAVVNMAMNLWVP
jgi:hypothetical protein